MVRVEQLLTSSAFRLLQERIAKRKVRVFQLELMIAQRGGAGKVFLVKIFRMERALLEDDVSKSLDHSLAADSFRVRGEHPQSIMYLRDSTIIVSDVQSDEAENFRTRSTGDEDLPSQPRSVTRYAAEVRKQARQGKSGFRGDLGWFRRGCRFVSFWCSKLWKVLQAV